MIEDQRMKIKVPKPEGRKSRYRLKLVIYKNIFIESLLLTNDQIKAIEIGSVSKIKLLNI